MEYELQKNNDILSSINEINESSTKLSYFKQISMNLSKLFRKNYKVTIKNVLTEEDIIKQEVGVKFNQYINNNIWSFAVELVENGYEPTKKEKEKLLEVFTKNATSKNIINQLKKITTQIPQEYLQTILKANPLGLLELMQIEHEVSNETVIMALSGQNVNNDQFRFSMYDYSKIIKKYSNSENAPTILNNIVNDLNDYVQVFLKDIKLLHENIGNIGDINDKATKIMINKLKYCELFVKETYSFLKADQIELSLQSLNNLNEQIIDKCKTVALRYNRGEYFNDNKRALQVSTFKDVIEPIQLIFQEKLATEKDEFVNKIRKVNDNKVLENKIKSSINKSALSVKIDLPQMAQELLKNINNKYNAVQNEVSSEQLIDINNLYENRLPEILKKFLVIDKEYRQELKNVQGKNAEQLMIESLQNIADIFDQKLEEVNQARLSDLSVSQRYTTSIKNSM